MSLSIEARSSRGTVLRRATDDRLRALIRQNLDGLRDTLQFNAAHGIRLFRISSRVIPFGGHPVNRLAWWEEFAPDLAALGSLVRREGMRVSMHPGQYTLLTSAREDVTAAAIADLLWHARFLDALGVDRQCRLVIHIGAAGGDAPQALARWAARYGALPEAVRRRLAVENDERAFTAADVLALSATAGVPVVLDVFHHRLNPGPASPPLRAVMEACFATWSDADGPPKVHMSTAAPGRRAGAHGDEIDPDEFAALLDAAPGPFDCMLEAKAKDLALFRLRQALARRGIVEADGRAFATSEPRRRAFLGLPG